MKTIFLISLLCSAPIAMSAEHTLRISTPRGEEIEIMTHTIEKPNAPTIVVAPGQGCNSKGPLFETLGKLGVDQNMNVIRFEWAYCLKDPTKPIPSENLVNELEDFRTALTYAQSLSHYDPNQLILAGKSLGSIVAYSIFNTEPSAKLLALLTPVCTYTTDDNGQKLPTPLVVIEENYPGLKQELRPVLMAMGQKDDLCITPYLFNYLKEAGRNIQVHVAEGDHGFRLRNSQGQVLPEQTQKNINSVINNLLNWADTKLHLP